MEGGEVKPRLLDLFAGAGGAARGYMDAGFHVTGVDIAPQPSYCGDEFIQMDAALFMLGGLDLAPYDVIHASPPCQAFSRAGKLREAQGGKASSGDLLTPTLVTFSRLTKPWIVENVPGAPLEGVTLCGSMFGLKVRRHRVFASNMLLTAPGPCRHAEQGRPVGVYHVMGDDIPSGGRTARTLEEGQEAMGGCEWMSWNELKEAIPPAYTAHLGSQLLAALEVSA